MDFDFEVDDDSVVVHIEDLDLTDTPLLITNEEGRIFWLDSQSRAFYLYGA